MYLLGVPRNVVEGTRNTQSVRAELVTWPDDGFWAGYQVPGVELFSECLQDFMPLESMAGRQVVAVLV